MWKDRLRSETGQIFVLFALTLPVLLGIAAVVVDVGNLYFQKRTLRGAADAAALSAAQDLVNRTCNSASDPCYNALGGAGGTLSTSVGLYSGKNAGTASTSALPKCTGVNDLNCYNWPYQGDWNRVEVKLKKAAPTAFAKIFGVSNVNVSARAVAGLRPGIPPPFSFVSLNRSGDNHTLILQVGGRLVVTSGIYVNSSHANDGFDIKGDKDTQKGELTAPAINTRGGWEVYDPGSVVRVGSGANCPIPKAGPNPLKYFVGVDQSGGPCPVMGSPELADPFDKKIPLPVSGDTALGTGPTAGNCGGVVGTSGTPRACVPPTGTTLQPGTYYGGICIGTAAACVSDSTGLKPCNAGTASVTMAPGTYIMAGGGFWVCGTSSINAPDVMIYNTQASAGNTSANGRLARVVVNTKGTVSLGPQNAGMYKGMTVFQNPDLSLKSTGGVTDDKCGSSKADEADIAFRSLGPDGGTVTTYGPYEDSGAKLKGKMVVGATQFKADKKDLIATGDHIKIENEEFIVTNVTGGDTVFVTPAATVEHADKKKIQIAPKIVTTTPGVWFQTVSGTIYAPAQRALFATEEIRGTSNLAVITGCIRIQGGDNTFDFQTAGLFGLAPALTE